MWDYTQIKTKIQTLITSNANREITASKMREMLDAITDWLGIDYLVFVYRCFTGFQVSQLRELTDSQLQSVQSFIVTESGKNGFWVLADVGDTTADDTGTCVVTGTGRRIKRLLTDRILVSWFDYSSNTEHSTPLFRAFTAGNLYNLPVYLQPNKQYITNVTHQVFTSIFGDKSTIKLKDASTISLGNPILLISNHNVTLDGFTLDGNRANNLGNATNGVKGILADQKKNFKVNNVTIKETRNIGLQVTNCPNFSYTNFNVQNCGRYGTEASTAQADRIGVLIDNSTATIGSEYYMGSETEIRVGSISGCGLDGLVVGVGAKISKVKAYSNGLEYEQHNDGAAGIYVRPPQSVTDAIVDGIEITDCDCYNNTGLGIDVGSNAGSTLNPRVTNVLIQGNRTYGNYLHGIGIASIENALICQNHTYNNGTRVTLPEGGSANDRRAGIGLDTVPIPSGGIPFKNVTISENYSYDTRSGSSRTQLYGVWIGLSTKNHLSETLSIINNDLSRNISRPIACQAFQSPVIATSPLTVRGNVGLTSFTEVVASGLNLFPINNHIYISASSAINIGGIDASTVDNFVTLENVSSFNITLIASPTFKMLNNGNLVLAQNQTARFQYCFETGQYVWKQVPQSSSDVISSRINNYARASSFSAIVNTDSILVALGKLEKGSTVVYTTTLSSGYIEINDARFLTSSNCIIQTKTVSGVACHDYSYDFSTSGKLKITALNGSGTIETGCNNAISVFVNI